MKGHLLFALLLTLLITSLLVWISQSRLRDFESYHRSLAQSATIAVASEVAGFVEEKKRLVKLFAANNLPLIQSVAASPDDEDQQQELGRLIGDFFPDHFSFTVTDAQGKLKIDDFDNLIGERCEQDLKTFVQGKTQLPRIHPHPEVYHFDILAPFGKGDNSGILFISFDVNLLGRSLKNLQTLHHRLMLIYPEASNLIEVIADGARVNWVREDYRMSDDEIARTLSRTKVPGTVWEAVDLQQTSLLESYHDALLLQSGLVFLLFISIGAAYLVYAYRNENRHHQAERYKDEFISIISHELRTPLTSIRGSLGLLESAGSGALDEQQRKLLDIGLNNTERLISLVNDLLDIQKIQAGQMSFESEPVRITELVDLAIADNQAYATQLGSRIEFKTSLAQDIEVLGDKGKLQQVLANLLSNAAKYGAIHDTIEVSAKSLRDYVRISITDHGDGIPESFRDRVFSKFAQSDSTDSRSIGGTGLGLNIVKLIVERHHGFVGFETESGIGTTFHVDLPVHASPA